VRQNYAENVTLKNAKQLLLDEAADPARISEASSMVAKPRTTGWIPYDLASEERDRGIASSSTTRAGEAPIY
jgi:hypothetical protein